MPFYTFETKDKAVAEEQRVFLVRLSFAEYDIVKLGKESKGGWFRGSHGPTHPTTEKSVKTWRRRMDLDNVNVQFAQPWESSKWDSFSYRAGYNMMKAKQERVTAEKNSSVGATPIQDYEKAAIGDRGFDLGERDTNNYDNSME
jgi:hypothetical protein